jgi:hypothetical protein
MNQIDTRESDLAKLARAIYESAMHEQDPERLEMHRLLAVYAGSLFDAANNEDHILHTDLGLEMVLFIELKLSQPVESEFHRKVVLNIIEQIEEDVRRNS